MDIDQELSDSFTVELHLASGSLSRITRPVRKDDSTRTSVENNEGLIRRYFLG